MLDYNCYIVDDEADSVELLQDYVNQTPGLQLIYSTTNPRDIISVITAPGNPKITFLDIEMPGITGLELAGLINSYTAIIFITSHTEHAIEAFEKDAYDYLVKPVAYPRFFQAVTKVQRRIQNNALKPPSEDNTFFIRGNLQNEFIKICVNEILYIESLHNYVRIFTLSNNHITYLTLKECELKLKRNNFLQINKSVIVNAARIVKQINNQLIMENNIAIPIGPTFRSEFMIRMRNMIFTSTRRKGGE